jgi:hypothetical protein
MALRRKTRFDLENYDNSFLYTPNLKKASRRKPLDQPTIIKDGLVLAYDFSDKKCLNGIVNGNNNFVTDLAKKTPAAVPAAGSVTSTLPLILMSSSLTPAIGFNGAKYTNDKKGGIAFDGVGDGLWKDTTGVLGNPFGVSGTTPSTMNCWIKFNTISAEGQIYMFWGNGAGNQMRAYFHRSSKLAVSYYSNDATSNYTPVAGRIYMITWTESGTGQVKLYVDGVFQQTITLAAPATASSGIIIGAGLISGSYDPNCTLYAFNIYNRVLSDNEIANNYNVTKARFI